MVRKILITGIAGSGKSTVIAGLRERRHIAIDLDNSNLCVWINKKTGAEAEYPKDANRKWIEDHRWHVVIPKLVARLDSLPKDRMIYVGGKISTTQIEEVDKIFDLIYLLAPYDEIIRQRLRTRTNNIVNFAQRDDEIEMILRDRHRFEKVCLNLGAYPLFNGGTSEDLVEQLCKNN